MVINKFSSTFSYKIIYIFRINDEVHKGKLKIGEATVHTVNDISQLIPNSEELNNAAKNRINSYTSTAGIKYELLHTELAVDDNGNSFNDKKVHNVLLRSGIERFYFDTENKQNEWFIVDLETAKQAIKATKDNKSSLSASQISFGKDPIIFRPEQEDAIKKTIENFKRSDTMLWNAKMRFGKTLTALEVVRRQKYNRTIIITHRPVVNNGWFEDFNKIFYNDSEYKYGSKKVGESIENLIDSGNPFVYFASIQDLRGSSEVGGNFDKDEIIFNSNWDLVVIDEAHEGTRTNLGEKTIEGVVKIHDDYKTKVLMLSGTPFNLLGDFKEDEIYTWDYIMEQSAKLEWDADIERFGDSNPYSDLPQLNIYTYYLDKLLPKYIDVSDNAFNFREFFRTWTGELEIDRQPIPKNRSIGDFVHKEDINRFLDLLSKQDDDSNYPYSTKEYIDYFRHSLWMVPGIKEAKALSKLLKEHPVFGSGIFKIVNVAGNGDEEEKYEEALGKVRNAITDKPQNTNTITISCVRLTTGVSVPEWTAVFMLSGSYSTAASSYLQTIFRVQTPGKIGGKIKEKCYVFDFAPDRTLKMAAQAGQLSVRPGSVQSQEIMSHFLNFCPIIGIDGSKMINYDVTQMLRELKKAVAQRVVSNGFDDKNIYNDNLLKLDDIDLKEFDDLKKIIGVSKQTKRIDNIDINNQGFNNEEYEKLEDAKKKPKKELTEEEKRLLEEEREKKKQASTAMSILRGISIRIPLLIYGANIDIKKDIDSNNFIELIDDKSWNEFMPNGVTKDVFKKFSKYYDNEIFIEAGRQIRNTTLYADSLPIKERIQKLAEIFSMFRNPDKETVLTPWKTVNMHMGDCIGGYNFNYPDNEPRFKNNGNVTRDLFQNNEVKILEINSKTGLYALYCAYSIYMNRLLNYNKHDYTEEKNDYFWKETLDKNIFIICKTKMAIQIVKRTLAGYKNYNVNTLLIEDIATKLEENMSTVNNMVLDSKSWNKEGVQMKFDAVVGNPPYQEMTGGYGTQAKPIYNLFINMSKAINSKYISMITPSRWFSGGMGLNEFRKDMLNDIHLTKIIDYPNTRDVFDSADIAGGVNYFLWDQNNKSECEVTNVINEVKYSSLRNLNEFNTFVRFNQAIPIIRKVFSIQKNNKTLESVVSPQKPFGLPTNYKPKEKGVPCWFIQRIGKKYADSKDIVDENKLLEKWKLLVPRSPIAGQTDFTKPVGFYYDGNTNIAKPGECCTESFIVAGAFDTEEEVMNFKSYLFTKTVRFLLLQAVVSQDVLRNKFCFVPDLGKYDRIYTDKYLCEKWNITEDEWKYIDSRIK